MRDIIRLSPDDTRITPALKLAESVFMECEAPLYSWEGTEAFLNFLYGNSFTEKLRSGAAHVYICETDGEITGMMAIRDGSHIALAFVKRGCRSQGIGTALMQRILSDNPGKTITVNAAPTGINFYMKNGFSPADMERQENGIVYVPMKRRSKK